MNFLSIDVGTTCCKCQVFSQKGEILAYRSEEYTLVERRGEKYVDIAGICARVKEMIAFAATKGELASLCISTIGESFVLLDKADTILFEPMLYTDPRGKEEAEDILQRFGAEYLFSRVGVLPQSMYSISKLLWIKKHHPQIFAKADKVMLLCDYLGYILTGQRVIDYGLASRTGVFQVWNKCFDRDILSAYDIPVEFFSEPKSAGSIVGRLKEEIRSELKICGDCVVVLGSHDQICATLGAGAINAGDAVDGMGTVECITALFDEKTSDVQMGLQGFPCVPYVRDGMYCTYMLNYTCGQLVKWFKNEIVHGYAGKEDSFFAYIEKGMKEGPTGILTLPYFSGAATPYQNIQAKGAILNLTEKSTDSDLYKSVLEGTAMEMRLNAEKAKKYGIAVKSAVATGGGSNSSKWLTIKADIQNIPIRTLRSSEGGLCGCAVLQAVATGAAKNLDEAVRIFVQYKDEYLPDAARHAAYEGQYRKYKKIYRAVKEFY